MPETKRTLYPAIQPFKTHRLRVTDPHEIYLEECGNPNGIPVLFIHGGPGGGSKESDRTFFDPQRYRIILFDQRGCGRSTPMGELKNNNTNALVDDIEKIRSFLQIEKWMILGGSWGSTLALLYAEAFSQRVLGLVLRGIFLARQQDLDWLYQGGSRGIYPDFYADFQKPIPENERHEMVEAYYRRLTSEDETVRRQAFQAWAAWEAQCASLVPDPKILDYFGDPDVAMAFSRVACHFFVHKTFIRENQILEDVRRLEGIPGIIVHGRYDMLCPLENAHSLHQAWKDTKLYVVSDAGHASSEPGITDALVRATDTMANQIDIDPPLA